MRWRHEASKPHSIFLGCVSQISRGSKAEKIERINLFLRNIRSFESHSIFGGSVFVEIPLTPASLPKRNAWRSSSNVDPLLKTAWKWSSWSFRPRLHGCDLIWKRKHFVVFSCRFRRNANFWKRSPDWKDLKTQQYRLRVDGSNLLKTQTFENDWSCDLRPSPLAFKKQRWRISTENELLLLLVSRSC